MSMSIRVAVWAVITRDDHLLLVEFDDPHAKQRWHFNLPGGGVESGETLHEAVMREVLEETGASVNVGELLFVYDLAPRWAKMRPHIRPVFRCLLRTDSAEPGEPQVPDTFQIGVKWIPFAELAKTPLVPDISTQILAALRTPNPRDPYLEASVW